VTAQNIIVRIAIILFKNYYFFTVLKTIDCCVTKENFLKDFKLTNVHAFLANISIRWIVVSAVKPVQNSNLLTRRTCHLFGWMLTNHNHIVYWKI